LIQNTELMLHGKTILITAGPTYEPIDPVRFVGNRSSGKMGFAIAETCAELGANVILITGPVGVIQKNKRINRVDVETAQEMYVKCMKYFGQCDMAILAAAVSDYTPISYSNLKIKKAHEQELIIRLKKTKDILLSLGQIKKDHQVLVGFSLETHNEKEFALEKLQKKNLDFIVLNSLKDKNAGFGFDTNKISIIDREGNVTGFENKNKTEVARDIVEYSFRYLLPQ